MRIFNLILLTALVGGAISGLFLAAVQQYTVMPLVFEAETYEVTDDSAAMENAEPEEEAWAPEDGKERTFFTTLNSVLVAIGFGLLLSACFVLRGSVTWRAGILWGLAGFAAFNLAPAIGLPPELPGDAAAELELRQWWWVLTVAATAIGLWIIAFQPKPLLKLYGVVFIAIPHLVGAPHPEDLTTLVPTDLRSEFIVTSLITNAIFWVVLGVLCAYFYNRFGGSSQQAAAATS